jgi:hypothetical protein
VADAAARQGLRGGQYLGALGALVLIASLFMPWFQADLSAVPTDDLERALDDLGLLGELGRAILQGVADLERSLEDRIGGNAWELFSTVDIVLLVCAVAVLALTLASTGALRPLALHPVTAALLATIAGAVATGLVIVKLVDQPDPALLLEPDYGIYVALGAAVAITVGNLSAVVGTTVGYLSAGRE